MTSTVETQCTKLNKGRTSVMDLAAGQLSLIALLNFSCGYISELVIVRPAKSVSCFAYLNFFEFSTTPCLLINSKYYIIRLLTMIIHLTKQQQHI